MFRSSVGPLLAVALVGTAQADVLDFEGFQHGRILTSSSLALTGMAIQATNFRLPGAMPVVFDTQFISTADPDLNGPPWAGGNLPINMILGNVIIVPENLVDANGDGIVDVPDDEGARPAGDLTFTFANPIGSFGFDIIDMEGVVQELTTVDYLRNGQLVGTMSFLDLEDPQSMFYDPTIAFGNNTINRIAPVFAHDFGADSFDKVVIHMGGSGAFDNVVTTAVPAPASAAVLAMGGLAAARRRR